VKGPLMLIVAPTRELAMQSQEVLEEAGKSCNIRREDRRLYKMNISFAFSLIQDVLVPCLLINALPIFQKNIMLITSEQKICIEIKIRF
jgi:hypothetical protein